MCTHACNPAQVSPTFLPLLPVSRHLSTLCGSSQRLWWHSNARQVEKFAATIEGLQKLHQQRGREDRGHPNYAAILETIADALPSERFPMRFSPGCSNHLRTVWSVLCACWLQCACVCVCVTYETELKSYVPQCINTKISEYLIRPANMIFTSCITIQSYVHMQVTAHSSLRGSSNKYKLCDQYLRETLQHILEKNTMTMAYNDNFIIRK